jgi:hypothetical protein
VSYQSIDQLTKDAVFAGRATACATEQAETYKDDARPDWVAVARNVLKGSAAELQAFCRMAAAGPGVGDKVETGDGGIDQSQVTDGDLLALTQANWPTVAGLYFDTDGTPKP